LDKVRNGDEGPDFILDASQICTSASVGVNVRAKVNYHKNYHHQVVIKEEKENARTDGPRMPPMKLVTQPDPDLDLQSRIRKYAKEILAPTLLRGKLLDSALLEPPHPPPTRLGEGTYLLTNR
jgi:hypothetical protein